VAPFYSVETEIWVAAEPGQCPYEHQPERPSMMRASGPALEADITHIRSSRDASREAVRQNHSLFLLARPEAATKNLALLMAARFQPSLQDAKKSRIKNLCAEKTGGDPCQLSGQIGYAAR
jgi:hypothetical protein